MGLGKTIQVLALLLLMKEEDTKDGGRNIPTLLVVPASLIGNWRAESERFAPALRLLVAHPCEHPVEELRGLSEEDFAVVDLVVTTYSMLLRLPSLGEKKGRLIVLDEAQAIKNAGTQQTKAVKALKSERRIALTGTPVENRLGDLWSLFDFLNPGLLGTAKEFGSYLKRAEKNGTNAYGAVRSLIRPYLLRRLKTDKRIIADLPEKTEVAVFCSLTRTQASLYQQLVKELSRSLDETDGIKRRGIILSSLMRFKQICNHPSQYTADGNYHPAASGKMVRLGEICTEIAERQEKVLVFTQFREITAALSDLLAGVFNRRGLILHGETPVAKRKDLVAEFQRENGPPFFVLSLKAGGTGLNLTAASHVIHFDRWWNPAVENQATDRAFRIGQKKNVLVHKFICRGTIEERIDELIASKSNMSAEILEGGAERAITEMDKAELMKLVALDLTKAVEE
jgi:non-specific serine/threonine protein kinase